MERRAFAHVRPSRGGLARYGSTVVDAAVVGGGFAGLALACGLAREGREALVVERQAGTPPFRRAVTLQPNGLAALDRIGALEEVLRRGVRMERVRFCNSKGVTRAVWDFSELPLPHPYLLTIAPGEFQGALAECLAALGARPPILGAEFTGLIRKGAAVSGLRYRQADGTDVEVEAACVVGADGAGSGVRAELGIESRELGDADPYVLGVGARPATALDDEMVVYCGPGYADGVVPMSEHAYFWDHVFGENRAAVDARDLDGWRDVYARRVPVGRDVAAPLDRFDNLIRLDVRVRRSRRRSAAGAALIGDAAGTVHPHSARGANLALEEAVTLADVLAQRSAHAGHVTEDELAHWTRRRDRRLAGWQALSLWFAHSFDAPNAFWRATRATSFGWARVTPVHRRLFRLSARAPVIGYQNGSSGRHQ